MKKTFKSDEEIREKLYRDLNIDYLNKETGEFYNKECSLKACAVTIMHFDKVPKDIQKFYKHRRNCLYLHVIFYGREEVIYIIDKAASRELEWWYNDDSNAVWKKH